MCKAIYRHYLILTPMPLSGKILEDSIRLSRIRWIKLVLYIVQAVALLSLGFFVVFVLGEATITPRLFLPISSFAAIVVLLLLLMCIESFFFRILEIRFARSSSARHLMAKNSMRRALIVAIVTGVVALFFGLPAILNSVEDASSTEMEITPMSAAPSFYNSDPLDLVSVRQIVVTVSEPVHVYLVTEQTYNDHAGDYSELFNLRLNRAENEYVITGTTSIEVPTTEYAKYYIIVHDIYGNDPTVKITIERSLAHPFTGLISLMMMAFVVANIAWFAYLIPIERKYSAGSIYK